MSCPKSLSIVIPVFNEEDRLRKALKTCKKYKQRFPGWEFIFVNDGSVDKTVEIIKKNSDFKLVSYLKNQGKGYALKRGVGQASKPLILITDIDFSTPLTELSLLYPFILKGADVVIGSRKIQGAKILKHQSAFREWLGKQFTNMSKVWLNLNVSDVTCGFKLFTNKAGKELFSVSRIKRWGYDAEILFLAKKFGYQAVDVPVTWENDEKTKVSVGKDILRSAFDLWLIRWTDWFNGY